MTPAKAAKLVAKLDDAESALVRAFNKWQKLRAQVRRADASLDREHVRATQARPGQLHPGDLHPGGRDHLASFLDGLTQ